MSALKILVKFYVSLHLCIVLVKCSCILSFPENPRNIPNYKKQFGTKSINIPYTEYNVFIHEDENITGYCATTFNDFKYEDQERRYYYEETQKTATGAQKVSLYCQNNQFHYENGHILPGTILSCSGIDWKLYEPTTLLPWCEANVESYVMASDYTKYHLILAGACFDIEEVVLKNFHYSINSNVNSSENYNDMQIIVPNGLKTIEVGVEVPHFNSKLSQLRRKSASHDESKINDQHDYWLKLANYQFHSIVQAGPYMDFFENYEAMLNIIWWPNLLHGNWKLFTNRLEDHLNNESYSYEVFAGTSGVLQPPLHSSTRCIDKEIQELQFGNDNKTIPAYIWNYLKASDEREEFVIVGYNAPFYDFFPEQDIIFCKDICDQITWLNVIRSSFRYSALGVIFCCSVEDVNKFNYLDGFPINLAPPKVMPLEMVETTTFVVEEIQVENENILDKKYE